MYIQTLPDKREGEQGKKVKGQAEVCGVSLALILLVLFVCCYETTHRCDQQTLLVSITNRERRHD